MTELRYAISEPIIAADFASADTNTVPSTIQMRTVTINDSTASADTTWKYNVIGTASSNSTEYHQFWIVGDPRPHYIHNGTHTIDDWPEPRQDQLWYNPHDGVLRVWNSQEWINLRRYQHRPEDFVYVPDANRRTLDLTELERNLAPIEEMLEQEGVTKVVAHFAQLLQDPEYRKQQLDYLNAVNELHKVKPVEWDEDAVLKKIDRMFGIQKAFADLAQYMQPYEMKTFYGSSTAATILKNIPLPLLLEKLNRIADAAKQAKQIRLGNAKDLLKSVLTIDELRSLETTSKILISRLGETYELLKNGKVNKLLPDGQKQGLCLISQLCDLPTDDIVAMKKLLLVANPTMFEKVAHRTSAF